MAGDLTQAALLLIALQCPEFMLHYRPEGQWCIHLSTGSDPFRSRELEGLLADVVSFLTYKSEEAKLN